ncbi:MAG: TetR/AcrR family transcriptional regulator [Magnetospirillum sp.]|nr:TetR/AcrR family transcriptional regulator [Magnetospirillum sp.]
MSETRNKPYHHGRLAPELVRIAAGMLESGGRPAVTLRAVARQAGVSAPAVYRHFADKEALLAAVAAQGFAALVEAFEAARAGHAAPLDALRALGMAYMDFAAARPHLHALMFGPRVPGAEADPDLAHRAERSFHLLVEATAACLGGQAGPQQVLDAAIALWSLVHGYATLRRDGQLDALPSTALPDPRAIMASLVLDAAGHGDSAV